MPVKLKRTYPALKLAKTPLIFVLAQVRMAPIANISDYLPKLQEKFRQENFPLLTKREFRVEDNSGKPTATKTDTKVQWEFINSTRTTSVLVDEESLTLEVTHYESGDVFLETLLKAINILKDIANPTIVSRIGLRYIDLIKPIEGLELKDLVKKQLRDDVLSSRGENIIHNWTVLKQTDSKTRLLVRYKEAKDGFALPSDLGPMISLKLKQNPIQTSCFGLLDTDHFNYEECPFDAEVIIDRACMLHDALDISFRDVVTEGALKAWE